MDKLKLCAEAYSKLFNIQYYCILGRKGKSKEFLLGFDSYHFHHLMGLHKLSDIPELRKNRERIFKDILSEKITYKRISQSRDFSFIESRFCYFHKLENFMDSNDIIFNYDRRNNLSSDIYAQYLLQNEINGTINYLFIDIDSNKKFFGRSFFPKEDKDFTIAQQKMTLLYKEKIFLDKNTNIIQYDKLNRSITNIMANDKKR